MRPAFLLLLAALFAAAAALPAQAEPFRPGQALDQEQVAQVTAAALAFMAPRILEPVPVEQLAMWGLRGLTTLDPRLSPMLGADGLRLLLAEPGGERLLLAQPAPADQDAQGWGVAVAAMIRAGWNASQPVRRARTEGVTRMFFDELFNHLDPYSRYAPPAEEAEEQAVLSGPAAAPVLARRRGPVLVLQITAFANDTGAQLARAITAGLAHAGRGAGRVAGRGAGRGQVRGLVLDLRDNRGGVLAQATAAASAVLPGGVVATTSGRDARADHVFRASGQDVSRGLPVVVLVDGRTASASEILAAALADQRRAVVVGSATLGKGVVQTILPLPGGGAVYVTWSRVIAPLGWPIQGLGVLPQVCTSQGEIAAKRALAALDGGEQPMAEALARERAARAPVGPGEALAIRQACPAALGSAFDMAAAQFLIEHPAAYAAALLGPAAAAAP